MSVGASSGPARSFSGLLLVGCACWVVGCVGPSVAEAQSGARRSNVAPPFITLSPAPIELAHGASAVLTATPQGGEAMLFCVEWQISEGAAGCRRNGAL